MKNNQFYSSSRRRTPWDDNDNLTPIQSFIKSNYLDSYNHKHPKLKETNEADFINSFKVNACKHCGSTSFKKLVFLLMAFKDINAKIVIEPSVY